MKLDTLSAILTCATLLLLHGISESIALASSYGDNDSGRRIMNGQPADPADFPFFVRLVPDGILCGGSVLSNYHIVTASHCIARARCPAVEIYPSYWQFGQPPIGFGVECLTHPQYDPTRNAFDIAIVRTDESLFDAGLVAIPLPRPGTRYPPGAVATIVGWGKIGYDAYPQILLRGESVLVPWDECNLQFKRGSYRCRTSPSCEDVPNRILCAQGVGPAPQSGCSGDSGGPFIINGELAAINTAAIFTGHPTIAAGCILGSVTMHTTIVDYLPWILSIVEPSVDTSGFPVDPENPNTLVNGS